VNPSESKNPWQKFQPRGNPKRLRNKRLLQFFTVSLSLLVMGIAAWAVVAFFPKIPGELTDIVSFFRPSPSQIKDAPQAGFSEQLTRKQVISLLSPSLLNNPDPVQLTAVKEEQPLVIETGLNPPLQRFLLDEISHLKTLTRAKPEIIAMVAMVPDTGQILAMAGFDTSAPESPPYILKEYPAASIFKIITASAVLDQRLMGPDTPLFFNGGKYTLYKRQLKEVKNKYTTGTTLKKAFSQSINPVFGKLGTHELGAEQLNKYAQNFGFNQPLTADFRALSGSITLTDKPYQWAEVGSGFNKTTTISPLFGAMITATLLNQGNVPAPYLVETVTNDRGETLYQRTQTAIPRAITAKTAATVMEMMTHTISTGTAKKAFRHYRKDSILARLTIGGKTGSLYNREHTIKFDWFTGFARDKKSTQQIVVSILVGHGQYIGTRAGTFARKIFKEYFSHYFAPTAE
jgi:cell division protein FtsI/penicillin-binding protein 2